MFTNNQTTPPVVSLSNPPVVSLSNHLLNNRIKQFGRSLSAMVMPNIGAFIAWGFITALFIPTGWCPNATLAQIGDPMMKYLLPLLIAYTAGSNLYGQRGAVTGSIATAGVIAGSSIPMFIGAMLMGPVGAWSIKAFDRYVGKRTKAGFEMLVNNFSIGIIGMLLAMVGFVLVGHVMESITAALKVGVSVLIAHHLLPLVSIFVEPGKVLFLNNAINHGICSPIGIQNVSETGRSIIFMIESNPGPGLGILLAIWIFGHGSAKQSAPGAVVIHFLGGIHEIFFPYILAQPLLLLATITGSASALLFYSIVDAGLVAPASPGSIIAFCAMAPKGYLFVTLAGVCIATAISFAIASFILKFSKSKERQGSKVKSQPSIINHQSSIIFACDAGMGSSALGATRFKSRMMKEDIQGISCTNCAIDKIPQNASVVVCQHELADRARKVAPQIPLVVINNFLSDPNLDALLKQLKSQESRAEGQESRGEGQESRFNHQSSTIHHQPLPILQINNIITGLAPESKEEAIQRAGRILYGSGYVDEAYVDAMLEREKLTTTYMGMGLAIPHGTSEAKVAVKHSGITILQYPDGVDFDGEKAHLVIGIAGVGDSHLDILAKIADKLEDEQLLQKLFTTHCNQDIYDVLK